jgi:glycosyltransferase involved in cell wall biosynthesis
MGSPNPTPAPPAVSVVIPARNEETNLERCLRSLVVQQGVFFEILVVDDGSTDRTREVAESFTRVRQCPFIGANQWLVDVRVLEAPQPLPEGWSGKVNAVVAAEQVARGEWLLFTDADTEHLEGSLLTAFREADSYPLDLLSYSPEQLLQGMRQKLVMPLIFSDLAVRYSPRRVSNPELPDAAANGQYILARADAHVKVGGFASVATELLEDVALARRYKEMGYRIAFRYGRGLVRTRMYDCWPELRDGWTKNLALLFPDARQLARKRTREFARLLFLLCLSLLSTALVSSRAVHWMSARYWVFNLATMFLWLLTLGNYALFYSRILRAHFPYWPTLLSFFGLPSFAGLLRRSAMAHEQGSVSWRGRVYGTSLQPSKCSSAVNAGPAGKPAGAKSASAASNSK